MTMQRVLKAALYARVSLEEQAKYGFSIDGQIEALRQYCRVNLIDIYDIYIDAGASGRTRRNRPQLERMLADAKQKRYDVALVWRISRLSRNFTDLLTIVDSFKLNGIALQSMTEQFDSSTALGGFVLQMMGAAAELERVNIAENVRISALERSRQGNWNAGNNVLGYLWVSTPGKGHGRVEVIPHEAVIVNQIFELYANAQLGLKAITNRLNQDGHRTKKGNLFSSIAVRGILHNRNYIGQIRYKVAKNQRTQGSVDVEWSQGNHPPIVSEELWNKAHAVYTNRPKQIQRKTPRIYPLTGLLKCPQCGTGMIAGRTENKRKDGTYRINHYYICGKYNSKGPIACKGNRVRANDIESQFYRQLQFFLNNPSFVDGIAKAANAKLDVTRTPLLQSLKEIDLELTQLENQQKQLFTHFECGKIKKEDLLNALDRIKLRRQDLSLAKNNTELELASSKAPVIDPDTIQKALERFREIMRSEPGDKQKELLRKLVSKITLPSDRSLSGLTIHGTEALMHLKLSNVQEEC